MNKSLIMIFCFLALLSGKKNAWGANWDTKERAEYAKTWSNTFNSWGASLSAGATSVVSAGKGLVNTVTAGRDLAYAGVASTALKLNNAFDYAMDNDDVKNLQNDKKKIEKWRENDWNNAKANGLKAVDDLKTSAVKGLEAIGGITVVNPAQTVWALAKTGWTEAKLAAFDLHLRNANVISDLNTLISQGDDINSVLTRIESKADTSIMGAYVQQKIAKTLSSDNLCKAANSCSKDGKNKNNAKFSLNELHDIFPFDNGKAHTGNGTKGAK